MQKMEAQLFTLQNLIADSQRTHEASEAKTKESIRQLINALL